jgi:hypothetical protein
MKGVDLNWRRLDFPEPATSEAAREKPRVQKIFRVRNLYIVTFTGRCPHFEPGSKNKLDRRLITPALDFRLFVCGQENLPSEGER